MPKYISEEELNAFLECLEEKYPGTAASIMHIMTDPDYETPEYESREEQIEIESTRNLRHINLTAQSMDLFKERIAAADSYGAFEFLITQDVLDRLRLFANDKAKN